MLEKLLLLVIFISIFLTWRSYQSPLRYVPGPVWAYSPLYRVFLVWSGNCAVKIQRLHEVYGAVVRTGPNHVLVSDPTAIFQIYNAGSKFKKTDFYRIFALSYKGKVEDTVFSTRDVIYHKKLKTQTAPRFSLATLRAAEQSIDACTKYFNKNMMAMEESKIDLSEWLRYWAFDVNSCLGFKNSFGFMEKRGDINGIISGICDGFHYGAIIGQIPEWNAWFFENKMMMGFLRTVSGLGDPTTEIVQLIEERIKDCEEDLKEEDDCLLTWLRKEQSKENSDLTHTNIVMHLANYFVAGSVATATSLGGVFYYLLRNPVAYRKLVGEIKSAEAAGILDPFLTYDDALKMSYLQAVLKEAMRLCPTNNIPLERYVGPNGLETCGYFIPEGTNIGISARMIHRNADIYGHDVEYFRPERWIETDGPQLKEMERHYFAFGRGDRSCSGRTQAMMEMGQFVTQVLRVFDIRWAADHEDWSEKSYWMPEQQGFLVKFQPRK
ncbi:hypothetical protein EAE96_010304 [Botrytis aclada]|nr:hypothetical protein EAE96_010304 [Botrytis aclada]